MKRTIKKSSAEERKAEYEENKLKHEKSFLFYSRLNELIDEKRKEGLTIEQIASGIGNLSDAGLIKWMYARSEPKVSSLLDLAKYFDVSLDYLCGLSDIKKTAADLTAAAKYTGLSEKALKNISYLKEETEYNDRLIDILNDLLTSDSESLYNLLTCISSLKNAEIKLNNRIMIAEDKLKEAIITSPDDITTNLKQLKLSYFESDESFKTLLEYTYHVFSKIDKANKMINKLYAHRIRRKDNLSKVNPGQMSIFDEKPQRSE